MAVLRNRHIHFCALLCFLFISLNAEGQRSYESFKESKVTDEKRQDVQELIEDAQLYFGKNSIIAFEKVEEAIALSIENGYRNELADAYFTLCEFNFLLEEYNSSIIHSKRAQTIYIQLNKWEQVYRTYFYSADSYFRLNDYKMALENYTDAASLAKKGNNTKAFLEAYLWVAEVEQKMGNQDKAEKILTYIQKEAEKNKLANILAEAELKLGEIYEAKGEYQTASTFYNKAKDNAVQTKNPNLLNKSNERIVKSNYADPSRSGNENVINTLVEAQTYFEGENDTLALLENSLQTADYYIQNEQFSKAIAILNNTFELSESTENLAYQEKATKKLYDIYEQSNRKEEALNAYAKYTALVDSLKELKQLQQNKIGQDQLALKSVEKQIDVLERERKLDQQTINLLEKERELNEESIQQQQVLLYVLGFILIAFFGASIVVYRNTQAKKRAHQLLYLKSLRAQMNPHFIFNSLNSVNNYIAKSNERAANKYLSKFSKLMRRVLEYSQIEFISLRDEIEILKLYIELEHERFKDKFEYTFNVDETINTEAYDIPPMLIQPFIENAIWHGLRYKNEPGHLMVNFSDKGDHIEIIIEDNGIGRKKSQELKTTNQKKHQSSGMRNVENRMAMIQAVFKAKISHVIEDLPNNEGTRVLLKIHQLTIKDDA